MKCYADARIEEEEKIQDRIEKKKKERSKRYPKEGRQGDK